MDDLIRPIVGRHPQHHRGTVPGMVGSSGNRGLARLRNRVLFSVGSGGLVALLLHLAALDTEVVRIVFVVVTAVVFIAATPS